MDSRIMAAALLLAAAGTPVWSQSQTDRGVTAQCARECLEGHANDYLAALTAREPQRLPLAPGAKFTENGALLRPGEGLWKTAAGLTDYRIYAADPEAGQVAFIGTLTQLDGSPVMLALRLKVAGGAISEIETLTAPPFRPTGSPLVAAPSPDFKLAVPPEQRLSREEMIALSNRNFDNILEADGSHFADDCQRVENRMAMSTNPELDYPIATLPGREKPHFGSMGCREQVESHLFDTLDSVTPRRYLVLDEERQLVFGVFTLNWYRDTRCNEVRNYGRTCRPADQQPQGLRTAEILRVTDGRVHQVEVVFSFAPYEAPTGWE